MDGWKTTFLFFLGPCWFQGGYSSLHPVSRVFSRFPHLQVDWLCWMLPMLIGGPLFVEVIMLSILVSSTMIPCVSIYIYIHCIYTNNVELGHQNLYYQMKCNHKLSVRGKWHHQSRGCPLFWFWDGFGCPRSRSCGERLQSSIPFLTTLFIHERCWGSWWSLSLGEETSVQEHPNV